MRVKVRDVSTGSTVELDLDAKSTVNDIVENCTSFWGKEGAHVVKLGQTILRGQTPLAEVTLERGAVVELIPDPEGG